MAGRGGGWLAKRLIVSNEGHGGGGLVVRGGKSSSALKNWCGDMGGVEKINLTGSQSIANREDCLDGCDGAGREEVNGEGVNLGVFKSLLDEILGGEAGHGLTGQQARTLIRVVLLKALAFVLSSSWLRSESFFGGYVASVVEMARAFCFLKNHESVIYQAHGVLRIKEKGLESTIPSFECLFKIIKSLFEFEYMVRIFKINKARRFYGRYETKEIALVLDLRS
uniref:Uncharacterized protein n=1 Tax=Tanacetum cinerariifolium TaxID=118510 RepID=A0A699HER8_TANCI|nr:hypothetical protein [Tanacetum cinerariifolium]